MSWEFELLVEPNGLSEGPAWDGEALLYSNIPNSRIMRYVPGASASKGTHTIFRENTNGANGLMFDREGRLYGCEGDARRMVRYEADGGGDCSVRQF